jgi:hypothetical protein
MKNGMTNDEVDCIVKFIEDCTKAGLITPPIDDNDKHEFASKFGDEIFGEFRRYQYSEKQEASFKIYLIFGGENV